MRKIGFTLAEVLITLGIIGVVAAITMPLLINNYEKHVNAIKVKSAYSILYQAIKMSEAYNGDATTWEIPTPYNTNNTEKFLKTYLLPYINAPQLCGNGSQVSEKCGYPISRFAQSYTLQNGAVVSMYPRNSQDILLFIIDVNGGKKPNILGTDAFYFTLTPKGLVPYGGLIKISRTEILEGKIGDISCKTNKNERHGCTLLLFKDGWEFKKDYPYVKN